MKNLLWPCNVLGSGNEMTPYLYINVKVWQFQCLGVLVVEKHECVRIEPFRAQPNRCLIETADYVTYVMICWVLWVITQSTQHGHEIHRIRPQNIFLHSIGTGIDPF